MKKLQFFSFALAFLLVAILVTASTPTINASATLSNSGAGTPGDVLTGTLVVNNTNATNPVTVTYELFTFTKGSEEFTVNVNGQITGIAAAGTGTDTFDITIPQEEYGTYQGVITVTDIGNPENTINTSVSLTIDYEKSLNVLEESYNIRGQAETTTNTKSISVKNTGTVDLSSVDFTAGLSDLSDADGNLIVVNYPLTGSILVGETKTFDFNADIPKNMENGNYWVEVTVADGIASDTFKLNIEVQPELCDITADDSDLRIDINEPDNNEDYYPGDNIGNDDLEIVVEACLYDEDGKEVTCQESDSQDVDENRDEDFSFDLEIPADDEDMAEGDYLLYIFAYEDKDEICTVADDVIDIDFKRENHQVIAKNIQVSPRTVTPGDTVSFIVDLFNAGTKDEDGVYVIVRESYLKTNEQSNFYDIEAFDENDNTATARLSVVIPENAQNKDYRFEVIVFFDDGAESIGYVETVTVTGASEQIVVDEDETLSDEQEDTSGVTGAVTFYPTSKISSWLGDGKQSTIFWIIGDLVLVIVAIYFVTLIFRRKH
ncbi:MAG: putative S-layer protein [Nanoarchaeota archaeon]|nr:putative S-layer protein [Nanoarchaeota archaeon]